jgi:Plasmid pRiA4b ORF-3-like protein
MLATLRFRKGARFVYEYDLNIPWRHEVRIEDRLELEARKTYPVCTGGSGACPPEDCGGPESFMARRDDRFSFDALEDLDTVVEVLQQVALKDGSEPLALDQETRWRLATALRSQRYSNSDDSAARRLRIVQPAGCLLLAVRPMRRRSRSSRQAITCARVTS